MPRSNHSSPLKEEFEHAKAEVKSILAPYSAELIHTDIELDPAKLYKAHKELVVQLLNVKTRLGAYYESEDDAKKYSFSKIVKIFNPYDPIGTFSIQIEQKWKHVNGATIGKEKVKERLAEEFGVWKNATRVKGLKKIEEMKARESTSEESRRELQKLKQDIEKEIKEAELLCKKLIDDFEEYEDIRICSKFRARNYGTIHYIIDGKRMKSHLSSRLPNVVYFEERQYRPNNTLEEFLNKATHAYGDVYFIK